MSVEFTHEQMSTEVAIAFRLSELGMLVDDKDYTSADPCEADTRYNRWLTRVRAEAKADALRDLLEDLDDAGLDSYAANEVGTWIGRRADRIEEEARG